MKIDTLERALGCTDATGALTTVGARMAQLPRLSTDRTERLMFARMFVAAEELGVASDILTVIALLKQRRNLLASCFICRQQRLNSCLHSEQLAQDEADSDIIAQLRIVKAMEKVYASDMRDYGVDPLVYRAVKMEQRALRRKVGLPAASSMGEREAILDAVFSGMLANMLYRHVGDDAYAKTTEESGGRWIDKHSFVDPDGRPIIAQPFKKFTRDQYGQPYSLSFLRLVSVADADRLKRVAPHLIERRTGLRPRLTREGVVTVNETWFNGLRIGSSEVVDPNNLLAITLRLDTKQATHKLNRLLAEEVEPIKQRANGLLKDRHKLGRLQAKVWLINAGPRKGMELEELTQWIERAHKTLDEAASVLAVEQQDDSDMSLSELLHKARVLRKKINSLVCDSVVPLVVLTCYDIEDDALPTTVLGLQQWIEDAENAYNAAVRRR